VLPTPIVTDEVLSLTLVSTVGISVGVGVFVGVGVGVFVGIDVTVGIGEVIATKGIELEFA
jgi:hypothetical protein